MNNNGNNIMIYEDKDGVTKVNVKFIDVNLWVTKKQLIEVYNITRQNVEYHLKNIYDTNELIKDSTCKEILQVQKEGNREVKRNTEYYNLDIIIALGYRIQSEVATRFRTWATNILKTFTIQGYVLDKFIDEVSKDLKIEFSNSTGFSVRNLKYMKKFYLEYKDDEVVKQLVAQVPWGHNIVLMEKIKDKETRKIYVQEILKNGWGRSILSIQIDSGYHLSIGKSNNNFENMLPSIDSDLVNYTIKDPYIFDFLSLQNDYKEKELEKAMINK